MGKLPQRPNQYQGVNIIKRNLFSLMAIGAMAAGSLTGWLGWLAHSATAASPLATVRYISPTGQDTANTCQQPATPCATLQHALDQAQPTDEIWLAEGQYTAVAVRHGLTQTGYISQPVTVRGGYPATFATPPDPTLYPTTLDAAGLGRVLVISNTQGVVVENLRLTGGRASGSVGRGGGIYLWESDLTLRDSALYSNTAEYGGGLYAQASQLVWSQTAAWDNHAGYGGAAYIQASTGVVQMSALTTNTAQLGGGALRLYEAPLLVQGNVLAHNSAGVHGGALYASRSDVELGHNDILSNHVTAVGQGWGGGVHLSQCAAAVVRGNLFGGNSAATGGGLRLAEGAAEVQANRFVANLATSGGGIAIQGPATPTLDNNVLLGNTATAEGAGALVRDAAPLWRHTTLAGNTGGDGAAVTVLGNSQPILLNTVVADHGVGIRTQGSQATAEVTAVLWANVGTPTSGAVTVAGALTGAADFAADGYHLLPSSAAVDAGQDVGVLQDVDGYPRPQGAGFDLGADELTTLVAVKTVSHRWAAAGQTITYAVALTNTTPLTLSVALTDVLPMAVDYLGPVTATAGTPLFAMGQITWSGEIAPNGVLIVQWPVQLQPSLGRGTTFTNTAVLTADGVPLATWPVTTTVPFVAHLPLISR